MFNEGPPGVTFAERAFLYSLDYVIFRILFNRWPSFRGTCTTYLIDQDT